MAPGSWLDTTEKLSRTFSIAAIPVVIAIGGWWIQRQLQDQTIRRDYVQLAVSILQNPNPSHVPEQVRVWAVDLLNENSPTKLTPDAIHKLKSGEITLSGFNFTPTSALTPDLKQNLETSLKDFQIYLSRLGLNKIRVTISPGTTVNNQGVAVFDYKTHSILVASAFANDDESVLRQFAHTSLAPSGPSPDYRAISDYYAIESGLATYFPCSFKDHPMLADKASADGQRIFRPQDLRRHRKFSEIDANNWASVQTDGSEVWGGVLWEIRQLLGQDAADRLIANTWEGFSPAKGESAYLSFANRLLANSPSIDGGKSTEQIREIFQRRGLRL